MFWKKSQVFLTPMPPSVYGVPILVIVRRGMLMDYSENDGQVTIAFQIPGAQPRWPRISTGHTMRK